MIELQPEDDQFLRAGGSVVVPTAQRAAALRLAYDAARLREGAHVWHTPRILPWSAWLEQGLDEARAGGRQVPRRLSAIESWWLWRDAVRHACAEDLSVLSPDGLVDAVRRSTLLLEDHGVELRQPVTPEAAVLLRARTHFERACGERQALWSSSWRACAPHFRSPGPTRLRGFQELGSARIRWLETIGVDLAHPGEASATPVVVATEARVRSLREPDVEACAAAEWCAERLAEDPAARLLVVVPRLAECRHRWLRAFGRRFDAQGLTMCAGSAPESADSRDSVAIEGGAPLSDYALIALALGILGLATGGCEFPAMSAVLRSAYAPESQRVERLRLDLWLREQNVDPAEARLPALYEAVHASIGASAADLLRSLLSPVGSLPEEPSFSERAGAALWARRFMCRLEASGWPGPSLSSAEQQQRVRFEELMGEMACLGEPGLLAASEAFALLSQLARRTAFEPATDDPPVTLTADCGDPIVRYDGIWVAGLTAAAWPEAVRADPMIPFALQRSSAMPGADPGASLRRAERSLSGWSRATGTLVLSYAQTEGDLAHEPSPLLGGIQHEEAATPEHPRPEDASPFDLAEWLGLHAPSLEPWSDDCGPPCPAGRPLRGGARLLELQALCPFRAFAELRLGAGALGSPEPGIAATVRGQILHRALELFWSTIRDSNTLQARRGELTGLARTCIDRALEEATGKVPGGIDARLERHEAERNERLFQKLIDWELTRDPFEVAFLEQTAFYAPEQAGLRLRLDRVDRLPGGELIVIDYKTGRPEPFRPLEPRPRRPQLPAYATVTRGVAAVAALYLTRERLKLEGAADRDGRLAGLKSPAPDGPEWALLIERWRASLDGLLAEFLTGEARVLPLRDACRYCPLPVACRVQLQPESEAAAEDTAAEES